MVATTGKLAGVHSLPDRIAFEGNHEVRVLTWIRQRSLPQPFRIRRLLKNPVVPFMDGAVQGNAGVLQGSDMFSQIHQEA